MSAESIYNQLVQAGMTPTGAFAMLGNWQAESAMRSNNVQDGYGYTDQAYTEGVDAGAIDFVSDKIGFGLAQWTHPQRKNRMLSFHRVRGKSIGDEATQVLFAVDELKTDYPGLWKFLCTTGDLYTATSRICKEFERPAINNIDERYRYAQQFAANYINDQPNDVVEPENEQIETAESYWPPRTLAKGMKGGDVAALQGLLLAHGYEIAVDGDFGEKTARCVMAFQADNSLTSDGVAGGMTWSAILKR